MESPPAVGVADPILIADIPSSLSATREGGDSNLFRSKAAELPAADRLVVELVETAPPAISEFGDPKDGRALDLIVAAALLFLFLPLMCLCALAIVSTSKGPLFFSQPRIGRGGRMFNCLKFRTMVDDAESSIDGFLEGSPEAKAEWQALQKLSHDPRITRVGQFMRRYCIDELPQLFNVIAGDMSMVGPRPIVPAERERFGHNFAAYCSVRPGLTGIWQVSGRHSLTYEQRVELDAEYARSKCLALDVLILWKTVPIVVLGQNG